MSGSSSSSASPFHSSTKDPTSSTFSFKGEDYRLYGWNVDNGSTTPRAVIVLYHGFMAHARYPTVRYAAEFLSQHDYSVLAADMPGHGESSGIRGYLASADEVIEFAIAVAQHAKNHASSAAAAASAITGGQATPCPLFVMGSSLGGNLALQVARHLGPSVVDGGAVLMAPMFALRVSPVEQSLLRCLSYVLPSVPLIPTKASSGELQYRDAKKRKECEEDSLVVHLSYMRPASALTCVELCAKAQAEFPLVNCPFLISMANEELLVDNQGAFDLYNNAATSDKTLKRYDALHGLLCEPSPLADKIKQDILTWLNERTKRRLRD